MDGNPLKAAIAILFEQFEKGDKKSLIKFYYDVLKEYDEETIAKRIFKLTISSKFFPKIADILEPYQVTLDTEMEKDWSIFKETMNNDRKDKPIANWVFTIRERLGRDRCWDLLEDNLVWFKKDYEKVYPLVKKGIVKLQDSPMRYLSIMGIVIAESEAYKCGGELLQAYNAGDYDRLEPESNWSQANIMSGDKDILVTKEPKLLS